MAGREGRLAQLTASLNRMLEQLDRAFGRDRHLMKEASASSTIRCARSVASSRCSAARTTSTRPPPGVSGCTATSTSSTRCSSEMEAVASAGRPGAVRPAPVALQPFLDRVGDRARALLDDRLTVATLPGDAVARLDATWVERALLHMLDNAAIHGRCSSPGSR